MSRQNISLQSIARTLVDDHRKRQKPNRNVTMKSIDIKYTSRTRCECQARKHKLIRNCLKCGRIVCEVEGSGPCWSCGSLVCTREERQILNENSANSTKLHNKLMNRPVVDTGLEFSQESEALKEANLLKNKLLIADADTERRTRVYDLQSDFYNLECDVYLTKEEREAIIARKKELKEIREREKRALRMDIDVTKRIISDSKRKVEDDANDPVIQSILTKSNMRRPKQQSTPQMTPETFVPMYDSSIGRAPVSATDDTFEGDEMDFYLMNEQMLYAHVEHKGYTIALAQPLASLLVRGIRRHIPWHEEVNLRGPLIVVSRVQKISEADFNEEIAKCKKRFKNTDIDERLSLDYPVGAIVGRALLSDCLSFSKYKKSYPKGECSGNPEFVLIFKLFEPLSSTIIHIPPTNDIYCIDRLLKEAVKDVLRSDPLLIS